MKWAMLCFESAKSRLGQLKKDSLEVVSQVRVGVHIYQTPPNPAFISKLAVTDVVALPNKCRVAIGNIGDVQVYCKATLQLVPATGAAFGLDGIEAPMFPDQLRYFDFLLPEAGARVFLYLQYRSRNSSIAACGNFGAAPNPPLLESNSSCR